jgi:hypothetical protein
MPATAMAHPARIGDPIRRSEPTADPERRRSADFLQ